jgi:hypothetical protein
MAALGLAGSKCGFGFDLYLAKIGISSPDRAMEALYESAVEISRRYKVVSELSESDRTRILEIMCAFAYQDYSRSAASVRRCDCCNGEGFIEAEVFTNKVSFPWGKAPYWAKMSRAVGPGDWENGAQFVKWSRSSARPVTERVLSAIRVAAMGKGRCWIRMRASGRAFR